MYLSKAAKVNTVIFLAILFMIPLSEHFFAFQIHSFRNLSLEYSYLIMTWIFSVRWRITDHRAKNLLTVNALFMILYMTVRFLKYDVMSQLDAFSRNLWYVYYIPMTAIAVVTFLTAYDIGVENKAHKKIQTGLIMAITMIICALVVTNDLHHLAFEFTDADWDKNYTHGPVYYAAFIWISLLYIHTLIIIKKHFFDYSSGKAIPVLLLPVFTGIILSVFSQLEPGFIFHLPEIYCFTVMGFWEAAIQTGIIRSNMGYRDFFRKAGSFSEIRTDDGKTVYVTGTEPDDDRDTEIHSSRINGGIFRYSIDVSELNRLNEALEETGSSLAEEQAILMAENKLTEEEETIRTKNAIYDKTAKRVLPLSSKIFNLASDAEKNGDNFHKDLSLICYYGSCIKRCANTAILTASSDRISSAELKLALNEILAYLTLSGVSASISGNVSGRMSSANLTDTLECFLNITDSVIDSLAGIIVNITESDDKLRLKLALETPDEPKFSGTGEKINVISFREDGTVFVTLTTDKGVTE